MEHLTKLEKLLFAKDSIIGRSLMCVLGLVVSAVILSPAIVYTVTLDGQHIHTVKPYNCNMTMYASGQAFPTPVATFYAETQEFVDVSAHTDWYLGEWRVYPYKRGFCPIEAAVVSSTDSYKNLYKYCLRMDDELSSSLSSQVRNVFKSIDYINSDTYHYYSHMYEAAVSTKLVGGLLLASTVFTWFGTFANLCLFPTIIHHKGTFIVLNILAWWAPAMVALSYILVSPMNNYSNWKPMFPGCDISVETSYTPGTRLLYYQCFSLGSLLFAVLVFTIYTLCFKQWTSDGEDVIDENAINDDGMNSYIVKSGSESESGSSSKKASNSNDYMKCELGHPCKMAFGLPPEYIEGGIENDLMCQICQKQGIDHQTTYAYFAYCDKCIDFTNPERPKGYNVCMICCSSWKISETGVELVNIRHPRRFSIFQEM